MPWTWLVWSGTLRPELPIIFGGWHPSLVSGQTLREDFIDVVVRHQGEKTLIEILQRFESGSTLDLVQGCWFKRDGRIIQNPDRPAAAVVGVACARLRHDRFRACMSASEAARTQTSPTRPAQVALMPATVLVNGHGLLAITGGLNPYDTAQVEIEEMATLVREHRLTEIALLDSNFLVDVRRALAIAKGILASGVKFKWSFQASTDLLCRMPGRKTCRRWLIAGVSSYRVWHRVRLARSSAPRMNKAHQHIPDMFARRPRKCARAGIRVTYNLIFGYPGEEDRHRRETLKVMGEIAERFDNVGVFRRTCSRLIQVFRSGPSFGRWECRSPESLLEWAGIDLGTQQSCLGCRTSPSIRCNAESSYFLLDNQIKQNCAGVRIRQRCNCFCGPPESLYTGVILPTVLRSPVAAGNYGFRWRSNGWWSGAPCLPANP